MIPTVKVLGGERMVASMESEGNEAKPQLCFSVSWRSEERVCCWHHQRRYVGWVGLGCELGAETAF